MLPAMSGGQWLSLGLLALLVFWMVGAYNRLVALRNVIGAAFAQVDELVQRRAAAATALVELARPEMASEQAALDAWVAAQGAVREAAQALRARPVVAARAAALTAAEPPLAAAAARVMALLEQHPALLQQAMSAAHLATLRETETRLGFARQQFNEAVQAYNDAARQFPTRLLVRLYGFGTAGRL
ncbi:MAG: LemA family protein [Rubrivivax sp.]